MSIKTTIIDSTQSQYTAKDFSWLQDLILTSGYIATQLGARTFDVVEQGTPAMFVDVLAGKILAPFTTGGISWKIICEQVGTSSLAIALNSSGVNRVDAVIIKIDKVTEPDVLKTNIATLSVITGTGISALSDGAIQTSIGANYSFVRLANVTVADSVTNIINTNIEQIQTKISISPALDINTDALNYDLGIIPPTYLTTDMIYDSNTDQVQTTQDAVVEFGMANTSTNKNKIVQSFIPIKTKIRGVCLDKKANTGTYTGVVTVALFADSAGSPTGSALATQTITNAKYNLLSVGEFEVDFSAEYSMTVGTLYWIVVSSSTADNSNHPNLGTNSAGGYANGSVKYWNTSNGYVAIATIDLYFKTLQGINNQVVETDATGKIPLLTQNYINKFSSGISQIPTGSSVVTIPHGLGVTPSKIKVSLVTGGSGANLHGIYSIGTYDGTNHLCYGTYIYDGVIQFDNTSSILWYYEGSTYSSATATFDSTNIYLTFNIYYSGIGKRFLWEAQY